MNGTKSCGYEISILVRRRKKTSKSSNKHIACQDAIRSLKNDEGAEVPCVQFYIRSCGKDSLMRQNVRQDLKKVREQAGYLGGKCPGRGIDKHAGSWCRKSNTEIH